MKNNNIQDMTAPEIKAPGKIDIESAQERILSNGIHLYSLDCSDMEVIRVSFVFRAGTYFQSVPFSASSAANLLSEGTKNHTAQQIAETLDFHGSYYDVSLDRDYVVISFVSLLKFFPQTLDIAREIILNPTFPEEEVTLYRQKRKERLTIERSKISAKARELFAQTLFGDTHPYGISSDQSLYDTLTRDDIADFYRTHYTAENCFVVCSGMVGEGEIKIISDIAEMIPSGGETAMPPYPAPAPRPYAFAPHDNAAQSAIRIGKLLFPRTHPDFIPMQVLSTVLGGYFGSRLVRNLREQHGYTYGAFASMVTMEHAGYIAIATDVATEATEDSVRQIFIEIERLRNEPIPEEELQIARNMMVGEVMRVLDGPFGIADVTIENTVNHTDNSYLTQLLQRIRTITPEELQATARHYLSEDGFTTVIAGDKSVDLQQSFFTAF